MELPFFPQGAPLHVHGEGRVQVALGGDGLLLTCGEDDAHGGLAVVRLGAEGAAALKTAGHAVNLAAKVSALAVSPAGDFVAVGLDDDKSVKLLSFPELADRGVLTRPTTPPRAIAFSPDGASV